MEIRHGLFYFEIFSIATSWDNKNESNERAMSSWFQGQESCLRNLWTRDKSISTKIIKSRTIMTRIVDNFKDKSWKCVKVSFENI